MQNPRSLFLNQCNRVAAPDSVWKVHGCRTVGTEDTWEYRKRLGTPQMRGIPDTQGNTEGAGSTEMLGIPSRLEYRGRAALQRRVSRPTQSGALAPGLRRVLKAQFISVRIDHRDLLHSIPLDHWLCDHHPLRPQIIPRLIHILTSEVKRHVAMPDCPGWIKVCRPFVIEFEHRVQHQLHFASRKPSSAQLKIFSSCHLINISNPRISR